VPRAQEPKQWSLPRAQEPGPRHQECKNQKQSRPAGQSESASMNAPWMDGAWTGQFFSSGSCSPANLPIAEGIKSVPGVLKFGFSSNWTASKF